jgi:hypothetical protein
VLDVALTALVVAATIWIYLLFGTVAVRAIRTGRWSMNGAVFDRTDRPAMYYFAIVMVFLFVTTMTAASYAMIQRWPV